MIDLEQLTRDTLQKWSQSPGYPITGETLENFVLAALQRLRAENVDLRLVNQLVGVERELAAAKELIQRMIDDTYKSIHQGIGVAKEDLPNHLQCLFDELKEGK